MEQNNITEFSTIEEEIIKGSSKYTFDKLLDLYVKNNSQILEDSIYWYLLKVEKYPLLAEELEPELFKVLHENNELSQVAKALIITANFRLVINIAKQFLYKKELPFQDLIQEGNIGLIKAVEKFDYKKGYKFSTYASIWIKNSISRAIADKSSIIRCPIHVQEKISEIKKFIKGYKLTNNTLPSIKIISENTNIPIDKIREILNTQKNIISLEENIDILIDSDNIILKTDRLEEDVSNTILKEELNRILQILSQKERNILIHRFGLENETIKTLDEIAKQYGVSRERIRQIEKRAIAKLRKYVRMHTKLNVNNL